MTKKAILLNLPEGLVEQLDQAAHALNLTRTGLIRRSLARDIGYIVQNELPMAREQRIQQDLRYANFVCPGSSEPLGGQPTKNEFRRAWDAISGL